MERAITAALPMGEVAAGFRAWFILQHYHAGYRPFTTMMEKTYIGIEGKIPKG